MVPELRRASAGPREGRGGSSGSPRGPGHSDSHAGPKVPRPWSLRPWLSGAGMAPSAPAATGGDPEGGVTCHQVVSSRTRTRARGCPVPSHHCDPRSAARCRCACIPATTADIVTPRLLPPTRRHQPQLHPGPSQPHPGPWPSQGLGLDPNRAGAGAAPWRPGRAALLRGQDPARAQRQRADPGARGCVWGEPHESLERTFLGVWGGVHWGPGLGLVVTPPAAELRWERLPPAFTG